MTTAKIHCADCGHFHAPTADCPYMFDTPSHFYYEVRIDGICCVREDLYDGTNDGVLDQPAHFETREEAEAFAAEIAGLCHMGDREPEIVEVPTL